MKNYQNYLLSKHYNSFAEYLTEEKTPSEIKKMSESFNRKFITEQNFCDFSDELAYQLGESIVSDFQKAVSLLLYDWVSTVDYNPDTINRKSVKHAPFTAQLVSYKAVKKIAKECQALDYNAAVSVLPRNNIDFNGVLSLYSFHTDGTPSCVLYWDLKTDSRILRDLRNEHRDDVYLDFVIKGNESYHLPDLFNN